MAEKSLLEMARALRRAKVGLKRPVQNPQPQQVQPVQTEQPSSGPMYGQTLDSWEPRFRAEDTPSVSRGPVRNVETAIPNKKVPEIQQKVPEIQQDENDYVAETRTAQRMIRKKARVTSMSISVSEEEARMLRSHAASMDTTFSLWARGILFRAMGKKMPARPKRQG